MYTIGQSSNPRSQRPRPRPQLGPDLISLEKLIRLIVLLKRYKMWVLQKKYLNIIVRNVAYVLNVMCFSHCVIMRRTGTRILPVEPGSSVSIVSGYSLDDRQIEVRSPAEAKNFSSTLCIHTSSEDLSASYWMGTWGPFPEVKHSRAWRSLVTPI
jgi:hypothetical protein